MEGKLLDDVSWRRRYLGWGRGRGVACVGLKRARHLGTLIEEDLPEGEGAAHGCALQDSRLVSG